MRTKVSETLKGREWFRPLAPAMRMESFVEMFPSEKPSPYMLFEYHPKKDFLSEATHVDGTSRIQTVDAMHASSRFVELLDVFHSLTGIPALINTSLNRAGKAIASTPEQVLADFTTRDVSAIVLGDVMCLP